MKPTDQPTTLELAILGLLALEPSSGYDLMKIFEITSMGNYSSSPGAIYPALRRLERRGLVEGEVDGARALRPRKIFHPTGAGNELLRGWLRRPIALDDVKRRLDELLLRFAFHSLLDDAASRDFLEALGQRVDEHVAALRAEHRNFPADAPPQGRMAFEFGIDQFRACARWARRALRHFQEVDR